MRRRERRKMMTDVLIVFVLFNQEDQSAVAADDDIDAEGDLPIVSRETGRTLHHQAPLPVCCWFYKSSVALGAKKKKKHK